MLATEETGKEPMPQAGTALDAATTAGAPPRLVELDLDPLPLRAAGAGAVDARAAPLPEAVP